MKINTLMTSLFFFPVVALAQGATANKAKSAPTSNADSSTPTSYSSHLKPKYSLGGNFPGGGSSPIGNALGLRFNLNQDASVTGMVVMSNNTDNTKDKSLFGVAGKYQSFLGATERRARPYGAGTLYIWKPGGDANKPNDKTAFGLAGSLGVEVWFIPEFSAFVETGIFVDASNADKAETEFGTFTSAIGVNFNFDI